MRAGILVAPLFGLGSCLKVYAADHLCMEVLVEHLYDEDGLVGDAIMHKDLL